HRRCGAPVRGGDRGHGVRARGRAGAVGGHGAVVAVVGAPRLVGGVPHRRGDRAGRVHRDRGQQRLHEPDGAAEPAVRGGGGGAVSAGGGAVRGGRGGDGVLAGCGEVDADPLRRGVGGASA